MRIALDNRRGRSTEIGVDHDLQRLVDGRWIDAVTATTVTPAIALGVRHGRVSGCVTVTTAPSSKPGRYRLKLTSSETPYVPIRIAGEPIGDPTCSYLDRGQCELERQMHAGARHLGIDIGPRRGE